MKNSFVNKMVFIFLVGFAFSCNSDDNNNNPNQNIPSVPEVRTVAQTGNWKITYFFDSGDETYHYNGYVFVFKDNGALEATKDTTTITGTWSVTNDSSNDDDGNSGDVDFNIFFAAPPQFEELSDDWDIISISNTKIELIDVSGGNGGTDYLTFEKN